MYDINVKGTQELILVAAESDIRRIIYTSSVATLGINYGGNPADEETPSSLVEMTGHYKRSKFLAEQVVQHLTNKHKLPLVIVNPSTPIGPRDVRPTPTGSIVLDTLCGRMPAYMNTGLNVAHVDDNLAPAGRQQARALGGGGLRAGRRRQQGQQNQYRQYQYRDDP